jgi:hypothetical protein
MLGLIAQGGVVVGFGPLCSMATMLAAQQLPDAGDNPERRERDVPDGHWCQRAPVHDQRAHACACHQHNCLDPDPGHVSAHTDPKCKVYCHVNHCRCERMDCP